MRQLRSSGSVGGVVRPSGRAALSRKQSIETRRRRLLSGWARRVGLEYDPQPADPRFRFHHRRFTFLENDATPSNICTGRMRDLPVVAFDSTGKENMRSGQKTFSAILLLSPFGLRPVLVRPKIQTNFIRLIRLSNMQAMETESAEFNAAFEVRASDRRWAMDFLCPRSMELLMWHAEEFGVESDGRYLAVFSDRPLDPQGFERACELGAMLLDAIPEFSQLELEPEGDLPLAERESADP